MKESALITVDWPYGTKDGGRRIVEETYLHVKRVLDNSEKADPDHYTVEELVEVFSRLIHVLMAKDLLSIQELNDILDLGDGKPSVRGVKVLKRSE
jgi:hypothetical protein